MRRAWGKTPALTALRGLIEAYAWLRLIFIALISPNESLAPMRIALTLTPYPSSCFISKQTFRLLIFRPSFFRQRGSN